MDNEPNANATSTEPTDGGWFQSLPAELQASEAVASWKDKTPADLLQSHVALEQKLQAAVVPPGENATPEEKQAFEAKVRGILGVPETVDGYALELPDGVPVDDPVVQAMAKAAHASGMNSAQLQNSIQAGIQAILEHREAQKLVNQEAIQKLWGAQYDERLATAIKGIEGAAKSAGLEQADIDALAKELPSHPSLVRMFAEVGRVYSEDSFKGGASMSSAKSDKELFFTKG